MWKHGLPILVYIGSHVISPQTLWVHNFVNMNVFSTKPVPIESPEKPLSIGTGFVENESMSTKLWTNKVCVPNKVTEPLVLRRSLRRFKTPYTDPFQRLYILPL